MTTRRAFMQMAAATGAASVVGGGMTNVADAADAKNATNDSPRGPADARVTVPDFPLAEVSLAQLRADLDSGKYTARALVEQYTARIEAMDRRGPTLRHVLEVNPDAVQIAQQLDAERNSGKTRGPLHGIPILLKDNIDTADRMMTTAGSLALLGSPAPKDALIVRRLREAGAVILGKTNLSEWANFRSTHSASGWSGRGGQGKNPYALDRNPSGSSSGSAGAAAASYCAAAIGTETNGSIVSPSSHCGVVGIKPTVGVLSRTGIVPISHTQDTAGPIARSVEDAAILLSAMTGVDPEDHATAASEHRFQSDYSKYLKPDALQHARLGVYHVPDLHPPSQRIFQHCLAFLKSAGADLFDPIEFPTLGQVGGLSYKVLQYEFKADLNAYLARRGESASVHNLDELIAFNTTHRAQEMPYFGQEIFEACQRLGGLDTPEYAQSLARCRELSRAKGIDAVMDEHKLDAIVAITTGPPTLIDLVNGDYDSGSSSTMAAVAGYPSITVPAGYVFGLPVGVSFFGRAFSESKLIGLAYAFEQGMKVRKAPRYLPTAELS
jgi:amidase